MAEENSTKWVVFAPIGARDITTTLLRIQRSVAKESNKTGSLIKTSYTDSLFDALLYIGDIYKIVLVYTGPAARERDLVAERIAREHLYNTGNFNAVIPVLTEGATAEDISIRGFKFPTPLKYTKEKKKRCLRDIWLAVSEQPSFTLHSREEDRSLL